MSDATVYVLCIQEGTPCIVITSFTSLLVLIEISTEHVTRIRIMCPQNVSVTLKNFKSSPEESSHKGELLQNRKKRRLKMYFSLSIVLERIMLLVQNNELP